MKHGNQLSFKFYHKGEEVARRKKNEKDSTPLCAFGDFVVEN